METTSTLSVYPSTPGTIQDMPRTRSVHFTPAWEASAILSIMPLSVMEFVLNTRPLGSPFFANSICSSILLRIIGFICSGATESFW